MRFWTQAEIDQEMFFDDCSTVVSDDVWKKFDLDMTLDFNKFEKTETYTDYSPYISNDSLVNSVKIRHHDCMWAGLCISKEHNSTLSTKKDLHVHKQVPAGRSLLIPKTENVQQTQTQSQSQQSLCRTKSFESDGDSTRPETPQSNDSDAESDYEPPIFRHDQISINERLSECFTGTTVYAAPVSVLTGQQVRTPRKRVENIKEETDVRHTLSDHSYHLNQPAVTQRLEHLGVQTPSESGISVSSSETEEEIDVVSYEKPCRQTVPNQLEQQQLYHQLQQQQLQQQLEQEQQQQQSAAKNATKEKSTRPRGRPPLAANARKRTAPAPPPPVESKRPKRSKSEQKRVKYNDINDIPLPPTNGIKCIPPSRSSSDSEPDTEKRSLHNNMERQRRVDLRKAFEDLRLMVPGVETNEKAPKVSILRQAAAYCDMLTKQDIEVQELRLEQERLLARVSQLRRDCRFAR